MALVRWEPFREMSHLSQRMNNLLDEFSRAPGARVESEYSAGEWLPPVDIVDRKDEIRVYADLPGLTKDDIHIEVKEGLLSLWGERKQEVIDDKDGGLFRCERVSGQFRRTFTLPTLVDVNGIKARFTNGVLEVTLPKAEAAKPKSVKIEVG